MCLTFEVYETFVSLLWVCTQMKLPPGSCYFSISTNPDMPSVHVNKWGYARHQKFFSLWLSIHCIPYANEYTLNYKDKNFWCRAYPHLFACTDGIINIGYDNKKERRKRKKWMDETRLQGVINDSSSEYALLFQKGRLLVSLIAPYERVSSIHFLISFFTIISSFKCSVVIGTFLD
jgi:hypothetical protein